MLFSLPAFSQYETNEEMDCEKLFRNFAFKQESILTNGNELIDFSQKRGNHLWYYMEPLNAIFDKTWSYFSSFEVFSSHVMAAYGLPEGALKYKPLLKRKLKKLYDQKVALFRIMKEAHDTRVFRQNLSYDWVVSVTIRLSQIIDVYEFVDNNSFSDDYSQLSPADALQAIRDMLNNRILSSSQFSELKSGYKLIMHRSERRYGDYFFAMDMYPRQKIMPYMGEITEEDIGNAILLGVHYVGINFGQIEAHHGTFYTPDDFLRHDIGHMIFFFNATQSDPINEVDLWPNFERFKRWVLHYVDNGDASTQDIKELQTFLFFRFRELPDTLKTLMPVYLRGLTSAMSFESYEELFRKELPDRDYDAHKEAVEKFFNFIWESRQSASGSDRRS